MTATLPDHDIHLDDESIALDIPLVAPPNDDEVYLYLGPQHLWFISLRTLTTVASVLSLVLFSLAKPSLWLFWVPFSIFTSYMVLTHYTTTRRRIIDRAGHDMIMRNWSPATLPAVDVFLPCAGP